MNKLILIGIGIAAVGLIALPQSLALFAGQHDFYNTGGGAPSISDGNQIPCEKCHGDIAAELNQPGYTNRLHKAQKCEGCHITAPRNKGLTMGGPISYNFHAAAAPACIDCHDGSVGGDARSILTGSDEVHKPFAIEANKSYNPLLKAENEACIGCHAHVAVDINWTKAYKMAFNATVYTKADGSHNWTVSNFTTEGKAMLQTYGNMSGQTTGSTKPVISISPTPPGFDPNNP